MDRAPLSNSTPSWHSTNGLAGLDEGHCTTGTQHVMSNVRALLYPQVLGKELRVAGRVNLGAPHLGEQ